MEINASKRGPRLHVKLSGELDHHSAEQTRNMLDTIFRMSGVYAIVDRV